MKAYRITREKYSRDLSGEGARMYGGRWNSRGYAMLYTSKQASLAALEVLVHAQIQLLPKDLAMIRLDIPESSIIKSIKEDKLPADWQNYPSPGSVKRIGDEWLENMESLILSVPSAVIPEEPNLLFNPGHPDFSSVKIENIRPFTFDEQLFD
ncbi:RES domain-containing protein [Rhodohalobacter sp. SW132]|uniref:RES family NAD+ phosphorylase n=1 Tax=Rhodohalobacter sp. SW132 TaxID=2293433 RepID=UPI000E26D807|nr:RES family NAD+ phosphorylase [Rhodohalobacter sp. SW132]REL29158.1 RES domain-containing protein [Rhodohalobacter sp. SW132]